jgi:mono/diheme cytochrome c family protein
MAVPLGAGGWVVITVHDLPHYVVAGAPVTFWYSVRQHGRVLLGGLDGRLEVSDGTQVIHAPAIDVGRGRYAATFTAPSPGSWTVDVVSGFDGSFSRSRTPLAVIDSATPPPAVSEIERGRRLFAGKGCITCHAHAAVGGSSMSSGAPELTAKRYQPDHFKRLLENPPQPQPRQPYAWWPMPKLELRDTEIASLVAFINADRSSKP